MRSRSCRRWKASDWSCTTSTASSSARSRPSAWPTALPDAPLGDLLGPAVAELDADELDGPRAAFDLMVAADLQFAPVLHEGKVVGTISRKGALRVDPLPARGGCLRPADRRCRARHQR